MKYTKYLDSIKKIGFYKYLRKIFYEVDDSNYSNAILTGLEVNEKLENLLESGNPFLVTRLGSNELKAIYSYEKNIKYSETLVYQLQNCAGFFNADKKSIDVFSQLYEKCLSNSDIVGIWNNKGEDYIINKFCPKSAVLSKLRNLEPYFYKSPWSRALASKKVLVIHPFISTIEYQYKRRNKLFAEENVLPKFDLILLKSLQTIGNETMGFDNWFDALDFMKREIDKIDYDIAIIGAGAYGLPLAEYVKSSGKGAIHLGGATQLLFGVKGARWERNSNYNKIINSAWISPIPEEKPIQADKVEGGCYW